MTTVQNESRADFLNFKTRTKRAGERRSMASLEPCSASLLTLSFSTIQPTHWAEMIFEITSIFSTDLTKCFPILHYRKIKNNHMKPK